MSRDATFVTSARQYLCSASARYKSDMTRAERLQEALRESEIDTGAELARRTKLKEVTVRAYLEGGRKPPLDKCETMGRVLGVRGRWLFDGTGPKKRPSKRLGEARVVGKAGAGGEALFEPIEDGDTVTIPDLSEEAVAVKIDGDSLGRFNGWYAVYEDRHEPVTPQLLGELCIVGTADKRTLIKWLEGRPGGPYRLVSGSGASEEDVDVGWAARVITLVPGRKR